MGLAAPRCVSGSSASTSAAWAGWRRTCARGVQQCGHVLSSRLCVYFVRHLVVHAHGRRFAPLAETELQRRILCGQIAAIRLHSTHERVAARALDVDERAAGGCPGRVKAHLPATSLVFRLVEPQADGPAVVGDDDVDVAVVVDVAEGRAAADLGALRTPARRSARRPRSARARRCGTAGSASGTGAAGRAAPRSTLTAPLATKRSSQPSLS